MNNITLPWVWFFLVCFKNCLGHNVKYLPKGIQDVHEPVSSEKPVEVEKTKFRYLLLPVSTTK